MMRVISKCPLLNASFGGCQTADLDERVAGVARRTRPGNLVNRQFISSASSPPEIHPAHAAARSPDKTKGLRQ
jgi:hypothetical protein